MPPSEKKLGDSCYPSNSEEVQFLDKAFRLIYQKSGFEVVEYL